MPRFNQRGAVHLIILFIIFIGIVGVVYLVTSGPLKIFPKASVSGPITPTSSLGFYSANTDYSIGEEVAVQVLVHSDITPANLFDAKISFDPQVLQLGRVDVTSTFIKSWVEQYWGDSGKISLIGGVPNPGFQSNIGDTAVMATLYFTVLKSGQTTISFDELSGIYSNADNNNILVGKDSINLSMKSVGTTPEGDVLTYNLVPNWNFIGISLSLSQSLSSSDFLTGSEYANNKCDSIIGFDPTKGGVTSYFSDPSKAILNNLDSLEAGSGYQVHCSEPVTFKLSGTYLNSNPAVDKGWNMIALPVTQNNNVPFSAATILPQLSADLSCNIITHQKSGAATNSTSSSSNSDPSIEVYDINSTDPGKKIDFALSNTEGYWVYCDNKEATPSSSPKPVSTPVPGTGDGNGDGKINLVDLSILLSDFNKTGGFRAGIDLNGDGIINTFDFVLMKNLLVTNKVIRG